MYTDPTGHREYCEDEKGGRCPKEKPKKPTYNGETFRRSRFSFGRLFLLWLFAIVFMERR
jgi:hypothetical protein